MTASAAFVCALVVVVVVVVVVVAGTVTRAPAAGPSRLMVSASEWDLMLSRGRLGPGPAIVQLPNRGEDDHDLRLKRISRRPGLRTARWRVTPRRDVGGAAAPCARSLPAVVLAAGTSGARNARSGESVAALILPRSNRHERKLKWS
jgi:hypothetical protein